MSNNATRFYGKYRGTVVQNVDPEQRGRIQAIVPDATGMVPGTWATACVPLTGKSMGTYVVPQIGSGVWIEFEQGDLDYPIWTAGSGDRRPTCPPSRWRVTPSAPASSCRRRCSTPSC
ncbi:phage baseplate assembly protein V [Tessaracoccus coleopterorum]|uniref:phage baseplate assembly protein V n=1 Tax=Tessaracoccus coleopterorum TaxID=2714950 RepID=UPI0018D3D3E5|nr:phage baseplate assembly protein V [Tessaracoccus coleopterorum]